MLYQSGFVLKYTEIKNGIHNSFDVEFHNKMELFRMQSKQTKGEQKFTSFPMQEFLDKNSILIPKSFLGDWKNSPTYIHPVPFLFPLKVQMVGQHKNTVIHWAFKIMSSINHLRRPLSTPLFIEAQAKNQSSWSLQLSLQWTKLYSQELKNYVNSIEMSSGGVHLDAILEALQSVIQEAALHISQLSKFHDAQLELRDITEGLTGMLSLLVAEPEFAGQTKDKLTNADLSEEITTEVLEKFRLYFEHPPSESIVQRFEAYISRVAASAGQRSFFQSTPLWPRSI